MTISSLNFDTKNKHQSQDLVIWEECGDGKRPNILYDSSKTDNVMDVDYVKCSVTGDITKIELL